MLVFKSNTQMRKLSPHVTIYRFPLAALSSITNRLTGLYLSGAFVAVGITSMTSYQMPTHPFLESVTAGCLCYHTLGGIRHYVWDWKPSLMTNTIARSSSVGLLATSIGFWRRICLKTNPGYKMNMKSAISKLREYSLMHCDWWWGCRTACDNWSCREGIQCCVYFKLFQRVPTVAAREDNAAGQK